MTELEGAIKFWENQLKNRGLLAISTAAIIERTVKFLKELKAQQK